MSNSRGLRGVVGFSLGAMGQPGPEDVAGCVDVGVVDVPAAATSKHAGVTVGLLDVAAVGAGLGGVPGVHRDDLPPSVFQGE